MTSTTLALYWAGFLLGVGAAAPIGPVNVEIIRRGLTVGFISAFFLGCGAVTADCVYFGLSIGLTEQLSFIESSRWIRTLLFVVGGGMLVWLGAISLRTLARPADEGFALESLGATDVAGDADKSGDKGEDASRQPHSVATVGVRGYATGLAMTLANPMTIAFWLSVAGSFAAAGGGGSPWFQLLGVASGAFGWVVFIVSVVTFARRWVGSLFLRTVNLISGLILLGFGISFWVRVFL